MLTNRSVPTDTILPHVVYRDVAEAIAWLTKTFGFTEHYRYGDPASPSGVQVQCGNAWIMLRRAPSGPASPAQLGYGTQSLTVFVDDVDGHYGKAKAAGAKIVEDLHEKPNMANGSMESWIWTAIIGSSRGTRET